MEIKISQISSSLL